MLSDDDRELLELAAKAAGYKIAWEGGCVTGWMAGGSWWNPLTDDGDALRLAVTLELDVLCASVRSAEDDIEITIQAGVDPCAATRRAIVRAAAALEVKEHR